MFKKSDSKVYPLFLLNKMLRNQAFQTRFSTISNIQVVTQPLIGTPEDDDTLWKSCTC